MSHLTFAEAIVVGAVQGITELFPVSSLGHNVLIPALVGGSWARDLNVSKAESPYLAFIVGLHVATALALLVYFWRDWIRIIGGFFTSLRDRAVTTPDQRLAWMIIIATIPVGIVGLLAEHTFRVIFGKHRRVLPDRQRGGPLRRGALAAAVIQAGRRAGHRRAGARPGGRRRAGIRHGAGRPADARPARGRSPGGAAAGVLERGPLGRAAVQGGVPRVPAHRLHADPRAVRRHQPRRHRDGDRHVPQPVPRGRRAVLVPAVHPRHPGRRRAQDPGRSGTGSAARSWSAACCPGSAPTWRCVSSCGTSRPARSTRSRSTAWSWGSAASCTSTCAEALDRAVRRGRAGLCPVARVRGKRSVGLAGVDPRT